MYNFMIGVLKQTEYFFFTFIKYYFLSMGTIFLMYSNINHTYGKYIDILIEIYYIYYTF